MKTKLKKLTLKKSTLSNLASGEMDAKRGGNPTNGANCAYTNACTHKGYWSCHRYCFSL